MINKDILRKNALFCEICNLYDWKLPIRRMIPEEKFHDYNEAVIHVTGGGLKIEGEANEEGKIPVTSNGYYYHNKEEKIKDLLTMLDKLLSELTKLFRR